MNIQSAIALLQNISYKPGWTFRFSEGFMPDTIVVDVEYYTWNSNRENAPEYTRPVWGSMTYHLPVGGLSSDLQLYRAFLKVVILPTEEHESREFLRIAPNYWAPFHPHTEDGIRAWSNIRV